MAFGCNSEWVWMGITVIKALEDKSSLTVQKRKIEWRLIFSVIFSEYRFYRNNTKAINQLRLGLTKLDLPYFFIWRIGCNIILKSSEILVKRFSMCPLSESKIYFRATRWRFRTLPNKELSSPKAGLVDCIFKTFRLSVFYIYGHVFPEKCKMIMVWRKVDEIKSAFYSFSEK